MLRGGTANFRLVRGTLVWETCKQIGPGTWGRWMIDVSRCSLRISLFDLKITQLSWRKPKILKFHGNQWWKVPSHIMKGKSLIEAMKCTTVGDVLLYIWKVGSRGSKVTYSTIRVLQQPETTSWVTSSDTTCLYIYCIVYKLIMMYTYMYYMYV